MSINLGYNPQTYGAIPLRPMAQNMGKAYSNSCSDTRAHAKHMYMFVLYLFYYYIQCSLYTDYAVESQDIMYTNKYIKYKYCLIGACGLRGNQWSVYVLTKLQLSLFVCLLRRVGPSVPPLLFAVGINKFDAFEMAVKRGSVPMILLLRAAGAQATPEVPYLEKWLQVEAHAYKNIHIKTIISSVS